MVAITFDGIKYANVRSEAFFQNFVEVLDYYMQFTLQIIEARNSFLAQKNAEH